MKKHHFRNYVTGFTFLLLAVSGAFAQTATTEFKAGGGIATLYALDPLARTLCFDDGREGGVFQQNEVRNRCSSLDFNAYNEDALTVGIEGGQNGAIIDLGNALELQKRYGYTETVGNGQGFASLRAANGKIYILKERQPHTEQELNESALLFAGSRSSASANVKLGHIYLARLTDRNDKTFERIVKLIVISYTPNEAVTIRWQVL